MTAFDVAKRYFELALADAEASELDTDAMARAMLGLIVTKYLETRTIQDVQSELTFLAENCDPDTDYIFMRP